MKRALIAGVAVVLIAAGVLSIVVAAALRNRSNEIVGSGGSSGDGKSFVDEKEWRDIEWIEDFTLTERNGREFDSKELDGEVWVASFFFSSCPASCKVQNDHIYRLHKKWGPRGVTFVSITCDPETDTPEKLREYAYRFEADPEDWLFLTGDLLHLKRIGGEVFGVHVDKGVHLDTLMLVDRWGKVRGHFDWHDPSKLVELEESLETLLAETEPPADEEKPAENRLQQLEDFDEDEMFEEEPRDEELLEDELPDLPSRKT